MIPFYMMLGIIVASKAIASQSPSLDRLSDLQLEITYLNQKKSVIESEITDELHHEQYDEIKSVDKMLSYQWTEFVTEQQSAESYEQQAKDHTKELQAIDVTINSLMDEVLHLSYQL